MTLSRRKFIQGGLGMLGLMLSAEEIFQLQAQASVRKGQKQLVLIQLSGGNDGLNTVVPYGQGAYYDARPQIAISQKDVLRLNDQIGLHPSMTGMRELFSDGKLAIIEGAGYGSPNRSHFRSIEIWQTAQPEKIGDTGWLGRYLDLAYSGQNNIALPAINVDPMLPKTLYAKKIVVPSVNNIYEFRFKSDPHFRKDRDHQIEAFKNIYESFESKRPHAEMLRRAGLEADQASDSLLKIVKNYKSNIKYPNGKLGDGLKFISQMITGGVSAPIFTVSLDGFDTHANQQRAQAGLLKQLSDTLLAFQSDLKDHGLEDNVLTLVFSEFGRRVQENNGKGTDHGTAEPLFLVGSSVKGGIYGEAPSLTSLDAGDLKHTVDFRTVYATVLESWLGADSVDVLGKRFETLPVLLA
ncbi:MAG: transcriptional initiation protein Tat [Candidatus Melainabacteria bacterium]|nr:MAG: transcriptional initiation protein Tat [Candidatus Melainabacteria bacterium]